MPRKLRKLSVPCTKPEAKRIRKLLKAKLHEKRKLWLEYGYINPKQFTKAVEQNLTRIRAYHKLDRRVLYICAICNYPSTERHHKGYESFLAACRPDRYAQIYVDFRSQDIVHLCNLCHLAVHIYYLNKLVPDIKDKVRKMINNGSKPSLYWCERLRLKFIRLTDLAIEELRVKGNMKKTTF